MSNLMGYPMYKFRIFPAGSSIPYLLSLTPLVILSTFWIFSGVGKDIFVDIFVLETGEICFDNHVAPSVFVIGCEQCGTTAFHSAMVNYFPQLNNGVPSSDSDDGSYSKHFFDVDYEHGMNWYVSHYPNCSTVLSISGSDYAEDIETLESESVQSLTTVSTDCTDTYLQNPNTAERLFKSYSRVGTSHLRFISILRDPIDRLRSLFLSEKRQGSLDLIGFNITKECLKDVLSCEAYSNITFDMWARLQVSRAEECSHLTSTSNIWPDCGTDGIFGGIYSLQLEMYLRYFQGDQISLVRFEAATEDRRQCMDNVGDWLGFTGDANLTKGPVISDQPVKGDFMLENDDSWLSTEVQGLLEAFYQPYASDLFSIIKRENVEFIDVVERNELF